MPAEDLDPEVKLPTKSSVASVLGIDQLGGVAQFALGVGSLFVSQLAALVGMLVASIGAGAADKIWDESPAGKEGAVARLARAVGATSVSVPVVVTIDDCDQLDPDLAVTLIENLIDHIDGQVLVVAAANPDGDLLRELTSRARYGLTEGRIHTVKANPDDMGYQARVDLAAELCPNMPAIVTRRIAQRTRTFVDVFAVAAAELLTEVDACSDAAATMTVVNDVIDARVNRAPPSELAVTLAWAGGILHARQAERAAEILAEEQHGNDSDVIRFDSLVRLADPASPRLTQQVKILAASEKHRLAKIILDTALEIGEDPRAGLADKVVAWQAAHRVRKSLQDRRGLEGLQCQLMRGLEDLGELDTAYQVARAALKFRATQPSAQRTPEFDELSAAVIRLAQTRRSRRDAPLISATIAAVAAGGTAIGLEARIWAAIDLLGQPGQRDKALALTDQITAELSRRNDLGTVGNRWRLLLAFHAGRVGNPALTQQLLAPILVAPGSPEYRDAAQALYSVAGPKADTRLQIIGLNAELAALPPNADDDRLRVHHALAADYDHLGDYRLALHHSQQELILRRRIQGVDHPDTLTTRNKVASCTGQSGHLKEALRLFQELLPDQMRVLGPDHPSTLTTRAGIAFSTAESGHPVEALRLYRELLPDRERVLGPDHPDTLSTRNNIAAVIGRCGRGMEALRLFQEVLPDRERVLGPDHSDTLSTRSSIASYTAGCGRYVEALRLFQELLGDQERVLGSDDPDTLTTRNEIAFCTAGCGRHMEALRLFQELLADREQILGPDHPNTLITRSNMIYCIARCGRQVEALQLLQELLRDQERVLGPDHPDILITRRAIQQLGTPDTSPAG